MVDRLRAYRRWRIRRLALLLPVFLAALCTQLWLAAGSSAPAWLRLVSLGTSGLIVALIGYFVAQTVHCSRLHARGNRAGARFLREQLAPSGRAALAAAALLAILNLIPYLIPSDPTRTPPRPSGRRFHLWSEPAPTTAAALTEPESLPPMGPPEVPPPPSSRPSLQPILESLPLQLAVEEMGSDREVPAVLAFLSSLQREPEKPAGGESEDELPKYRPDVKDGFQLILEHEAPFEFARLGVPDERTPEEWLLPELRLEISFLNGPSRGAEYLLHLDIPVSRNESFRADIAVGKLPGHEYMEESASESWERVTLAYAHRLAGYTRHSPFDLAVSIGISVDRYKLQGEEGPVDPGARLSPYIAVDAAIWQQGAAGLLLHAGYSIPVNATGASSGILDLSATLRIDLTENVSVHAGYRYLVVRLRDYEEADFGSVSRGGLSDSFSGPIIGLDIRF